MTQNREKHKTKKEQKSDKKQLLIAELEEYEDYILDNKGGKRKRVAGYELRLLTPCWWLGKAQPGITLRTHLLMKSEVKGRTEATV